LSTDPSLAWPPHPVGKGGADGDVWSPPKPSPLGVPSSASRQLLKRRELVKHGTVVLVGRDGQKLDEMQKTIEQRGQHAVSVMCDLSDPASVRGAAAKIIALNLPIAGLLNNAGIYQLRATKNAQGWDMTFATNHLGPFALTEALTPHLPDGANVVFVSSGTEDPVQGRHRRRLPRRSLRLR
jgi:NAD(P)-dependent dehydrogenase (short-subunit alcohol dehydrogenase family)